MSNCINLVVTKETTCEEIVHFLLTKSQYHTFTIGPGGWTFISTVEGFGYIVNCRLKEIDDWYYDDGINRMKSVFGDDGDDDYIAMIGNPWHTYCELAEEIVAYVQTN